MILALNSIVGPSARVWFDDDVVPWLAGLTATPIRTAQLQDGGLPGPDDFSHLLLSGSELSAAEENGTDPDLLGLIRAFLDRDRAVLGICYGHQMLARAILGPSACRRAARPEFGWKPVELRESPLFAGITDFVALQSHYDEVCDLTPEFTVLATTDTCPIQAFQYRDRPVWGVQFHPEVDFKQGERMNREAVEKDPSIREHLVPRLADPAALLQNELIFRNFFAARV